MVADTAMDMPPAALTPAMAPAQASTQPMVSAAMTHAASAEPSPGRLMFAEPRFDAMPSAPRAPAQQPAPLSAQQPSAQPMMRAAAPAQQPAFAAKPAAPQAPVASERAPMPAMAPLAPQPAPLHRPQQPAAATTAASQPQRASDAANAIQQSITRIHEACQAPPLSPPEYRALFEAMAQEINSNNLMGAQTITNIAARAQELGIEVRRDDIRFVLEVVSEADPWFSQGASAVLFSSRFRNFVVARCRSQGLNLSSDELDLIEAWFAGGASIERPAAQPQPTMTAPAAAPAHHATAAPSQLQPASEDRWWGNDAPRQASADGSDEFPRFVRKGLRG
jgi:hypothetical protein